MSFSYMGYGLPYLSNHAEALRFWEQAGKWRGESNERILDKRAKRNVTIRQTSDGSIACKLHATDVVTYHPDNTMTLKPWASVSSDEFANRLLRSTNIRTSFKRGFVEVGDKFYRTTRETKLAYDPDAKGYVATSTPEPFRIATVNRQEAHKVLKEYDYKAFAGWVRMVAASGVVFERKCWHPEATEVLPDRQRWEELLRFEPALLVDKTLTAVRASLYQANPQVYDVVTQPYLTDWREVERWKRRKY